MADEFVKCAKCKGTIPSKGVIFCPVRELDCVHVLKGIGFQPAHDPVNSPSHYHAGDTYETIRVIEAWNLNYNLGNAVKYISRAGSKGDLVQDLEKARWYLTREIDNLKKAKTADDNDDPYSEENEV